MNKLIKIKIHIETEIIGVCNNDNDLNKAGEDVWSTNKSEIISQALELGEVDVITKELKSLSELPSEWCPKSLPWLPSVYPKNEKNIGDYFKKET